MDATAVKKALERQIELLSALANAADTPKNLCRMTEQMIRLSHAYNDLCRTENSAGTKTPNTLKDLAMELSTLRLTEMSASAEGQDATSDAAAEEEEPEVNAWDAYLQRKEVAAQIVAIIRENTDTLIGGLNLLSIVKDMLEKGAKI